jgi:signal transduction histidine kinase
VISTAQNSGSGMIGIQVFQANPSAPTVSTAVGSGSGSISATPAAADSSGADNTLAAQSGSNPPAGNIHVTPNSLKILSIPAGGSPDAKSTTVILSQIPVVNTMYGVDLQGSAAIPAVHSNQVYRQAIISANGTLLGSVELSDGPAYGMDIVISVAFGWLISSLVGILIAAAAGWWISRRINAPILVLTDSTRRMASGDLSARATIRGQDEFGLLARSFNVMAGRVEETISALRRFVADAAHELQTPLTALRTNLELASGEAEAARLNAYLESAQGQVDRLNHLVRELLDLSRLEAGVDGQKAALDLAPFVEQLSEPYAAQAEQAGIELKVALPDQKVRVCGDEKQLGHAVSNLLENALKFTPAGGEVWVDLAVEDGWACLGVADTGIGIPPEDVPGLFQRFHRGHNTAGYPGSGLGLAIVQAVALAHGGQVQYVPSQPGGSRFTLRLPIL